MRAAMPSRGFAGRHVAMNNNLRSNGGGLRRGPVRAAYVHGLNSQRTRTAAPKPPIGGSRTAAVPKPPIGGAAAGTGAPKSPIGGSTTVAAPKAPIAAGTPGANAPAAGGKARPGALS
jgi:hypothetical protein